MEIQTRQDKELVWAQILYLFILPILLLYYKVIPGKFRLFMLLTVSMTLLGIIFKAKWTYLDIGIFRDYKKDLLPYSIFTLVGLLFLFFCIQFIPYTPMEAWYINLRFLILFIPISFLQEIVFRGVLMNMLRRAFSHKSFIIILNASLFALIHIIYTNILFVLPVTFLAGVGFAWMYYKYPNLILISVSHTILNFTAMILGFFTLR